MAAPVVDKPLELAADVVNNFLTYDPTDSELADWIDDSRSPHRYYYQPYAGAAAGKRPTGWRPQLALQRDVRPLPQFIIDRQAAMEIGTRSGLFAEIHRAWITVDDEVFLWNYEDPSEVDVARVGDLGEPITAVGLVVPRPDVFDLSVVRYLLAVATPAEVRLFALSFGDGGGGGISSGGSAGEDDEAGRSGAGGAGSSSITTSSSLHARLHVHETSLAFPTGGAIVQKIAGTASGRIFLAGRDGCLHELCYDGLGLSGGLIAAAAAGGGGVGAWVRAGSLAVSALWATGPSGASAAADNVARRARRVNHDASLVASVLRAFAGSLYDTTRYALVDLVVDHGRARLYTLADDGAIRMYSLCGSEGPPPPGSGCSAHGSVRLLASVPDPEAAAFEYATSAHGAGGGGPGPANKPLPQLFRPGLAQQTLSALAAASGVGGFGASTPGAATQQQPPSGLVWPLVSLHIVPATESRRVQLVAVSAAGVRLYFSALTPEAYAAARSAAALAAASATGAPLPSTLAAAGLAAASSGDVGALRLVYVRMPPPTTSSRQYMSGAYVLPAPDGWRPAFDDATTAAAGTSAGAGVAAGASGAAAWGSVGGGGSSSGSAVHESAYAGGVVVLARSLAVSSAGGVSFSVASGGASGAGPRPLAASSAPASVPATLASSSVGGGNGALSLSALQSPGGMSAAASTAGGDGGALLLPSEGVDSVVSLAHDPLLHHAMSATGAAAAAASSTSSSADSGGGVGVGVSKQRMIESVQEDVVDGKVQAVASLPLPMGSLAATLSTCDPGAAAASVCLAFTEAGALALPGGETAPLPPALAAAVAECVERVTPLTAVSAGAAIVTLEGWESGEAAGSLAGTKRPFVGGINGPGTTPRRRGFGVGMSAPFAAPEPATPRWAQGGGSQALSSLLGGPGRVVGPSVLCTQRPFADSSIPPRFQHHVRRQLWALPAGAASAATASGISGLGGVTSEFMLQSCMAGVLPASGADASAGFDLAGQRGFAVLTNYALYRLTKLRPIDQLAQLLLAHPPGSAAASTAAAAAAAAAGGNSSSGLGSSGLSHLPPASPASSPLSAFLRGFPREEAAAMCVAVACGAADGAAATAAAGDSPAAAGLRGSPSGATAAASRFLGGSPPLVGGSSATGVASPVGSTAGGSPWRSSQHQQSLHAGSAGLSVAAARAHVAYDVECAGLPAWKASASAASASTSSSAWGGGGSNVYREEDLNFSARFSGFLLHVSRLLRPVWGATVCITPAAAVPGPGGKPRGLLPRYTSAEMRGLAHQLRITLSFLRGHFPFLTKFSQEHLRSLAAEAGMSAKLGFDVPPALAQQLSAQAQARAAAAAGGGSGRWQALDAQKHANSIEMTHLMLAHRLLGRAVEAAALMAAVADPAQGAVKILCDLAAGYSTQTGLIAAAVPDATLLRLATQVRFSELCTATPDAASFVDGLLTRALHALRALTPALPPGASQTAGQGGAAAFASGGSSSVGSLYALPGGAGGVASDASSAAGLLGDPAASLAALLRSECPSFFSETNQLLLSADRLLASVLQGSATGAARGGATAAARLQVLDLSLRDAVRGVCGADGVTTPDALSAALGRLTDLAIGYTTAGYYSGVLTLALAAAKAVAPQHLPLDALPPDVSGAPVPLGSALAAASAAASANASAAGNRSSQLLLAAEHGWGAADLPSAASSAGAAAAAAASGLSPSSELRIKLYGLITGLLDRVLSGSASGLDDPLLTQAGGGAAQRSGLRASATTAAELISAAEGSGVALFEGRLGLNETPGRAAAASSSAAGASHQQQQLLPAFDASGLGIFLPSATAASQAHQAQLQQARHYGLLEAAAVEAVGASSGPAFAALLSDALRSVDALFHDTLYRWLQHRGLARVLATLATPYIEPFLRWRCSDADVLLRWYLAGPRPDLVKAARLQHRLATQAPGSGGGGSGGGSPSDSSIWPAAGEGRGSDVFTVDTSLAARIDRLASAVQLARQASVSLGRASLLSAQDVAGWAAQLSALELQRDAKAELETALQRAEEAAATGAAAPVPAGFGAGTAAAALKPLSDAVHELESGSLSLQALYDRITVPFGLHELSLVLLDLFHRSSSGGLEDAGSSGALAQLVRSHWALAMRAALGAVAAAQELRGGGPAESAAAAVSALSALVASVGQRLQASRGGGTGGSNDAGGLCGGGSVAFPLAFIVGTLETHAVSDGWTDLLTPFPVGWLAVRALGDAGVPWSARYDAYRELADARIQELVQPGPGGAGGVGGGGSGSSSASALALHLIRCVATLVDAWSQQQQGQRQRQGGVADASIGWPASSRTEAEAEDSDADSDAFATAANDVISHLQHCRVVLPTLAGAAATRDVAALIDAVRARVAAVQRRVPLGAA